MTTRRVTPSRSEIGTLARQAGFQKHTLEMLDWEGKKLRIGIRCGWTDTVVADGFGETYDLAIRQLADMLDIIIAKNAAARKAGA